MATILKEKYHTLCQKYQPKIDELQNQADNLATTFKELYRESQEAYTSEDGALAKSLALQGHAAQEQCEFSNKKSNVMRSELKLLRDQINQSFAEAKILKEQIIADRNIINNMRSVEIRGFETGGLWGNLKIELILDEFPQIIFNKTKSISYDGNFYWESESGKTKVLSRGGTIFNDDKNSIVIGQQKGSTSKEREERAKETLFHEIGHVVYFRFLTDEQQAEWFSWHKETPPSERFVSLEAIEDEKEDFAECFRFFKLDPQKLADKDPIKYNFIKEVYQSLEENK